MDLEGWEILPEYGFLEIHDAEGKKIFSRKCYSDSNTIINMNYFSPSQLVEETKPSRPIPRLPSQLLTPPVDDRPLPVDDHGGELVGKINILPEKIKSPLALEAEQEVSQVFFKKMKEAEFAANTKMDSPRSSSKVFVPQMDVGEAYRVKAMEGKNDQMDAAVQQNGGLNIWRWSLNGIGAICSFGVAAATLCVIVIGNSQKRRQQNKKPCFQIYADDKRIRQVVHSAARFNEAN